MKHSYLVRMGYLCFLLLLFGGCAKPLVKQYYMLNYQLEELAERLYEEPYPFTVRLRPFDVEKVYAKSNIVYRKSPYELEYYSAHHWAVRPTDMLTDLIYTHLEAIALVDAAVRRLDERGNPDYELVGTILAIEEYDSEETWFAHLKMSMSLVRLSDEAVVYNRIFDQRKIVEIHDPLYVVRTLSELTDYFASMLMKDLDSVLYDEFQTTLQEGMLDETSNE